MQMELDVYPIQCGWLDKLENIIKTNDFYIKGSLFCGDQNFFISPQRRSIDDAYLKLHINGNAIYNTCNAEFYDIIKNIFLENKDEKRIGYDAFIMRYFLSDDNVELYKKYACELQYTNFIRNVSVYSKRYTINQLQEKFPDSYLVHITNIDLSNIFT